MIVRTTLILFSLLSIAQADQWLETPSGFYITTLNSTGQPINIPAPNITHYILMGEAPVDPVDPIDPIDPPPPTDDTWGLVAFSAAQAKLVQPNDPNYAVNASKVRTVYIEIGKRVQKQEIADKDVANFLDLGFRVAVGSSITHWTPWKDEIGDKFNAVSWKNNQERGQGLIDIGTGVGSTSNEAVVDWTKIFIEIVLPMIIDGASLIEILFAVLLELL